MLLDSALERTIKKEEYFAMSERSLPYSELSHRHHSTLDSRTGPPMLNVSQEYGLASWVTELLSRNPPIISIDLEENLSPLPVFDPNFIMYTDQDYSISRHHEGISPLVFSLFHPWLAVLELTIKKPFFLSTF